MEIIFNETFKKRGMMKINKLSIICVSFSLLIILSGIIFQSSRFCQLELSEIKMIEVYNSEMKEKTKEKRLYKKFIKESKDIWEKIKEDVKNNLWQVYNGIRITPDGAISAAKLRGVDEVNKYLKTKGRYNPKDANGNELSKFFSLDAGFSNLDVTGIEYKDDAHNVYKMINWRKNSNKQAVEILYNFLLENEKYVDIKKEFGGSKKTNIIAFFADLNDDGRNEVIGCITHIYYSAKFMSELSIFILEKQKTGKYKNISDSLMVSILRPLYILDSKNEGYRSLFFYGSGRSDVNQYNLKYKNGLYSYDFDTYLIKSK